MFGINKNNDLKFQLIDAKQKIHELESEILAKTKENEELKAQNKDLKWAVIEMQKMADSTPADCKLGGYCAGCEFGEQYILRTGYYNHEVWLCNKAGACHNFVKKEDL